MPRILIMKIEQSSFTTIPKAASQLHCPGADIEAAIRSKGYYQRGNWVVQEVPEEVVDGTPRFFYYGRTKDT